MNGTLFKATVRANWVIALIFCVIILIYVTTSVSMFNPESAEDLEAMIDLLPESLIKAMGFVNLGTDLTAYLANYLYGFIMIIFPMIYCIIMANRLIAKHVDSGSMAYLLTTPNTRTCIATTQAVYLCLSLAAILLVDVAAAIIISVSVYSGMLKIGTYLVLNWVTYLSLLAGAGVGFFSSCVFSDTRYSLAFGAGIPVLFFVFRMLSNLGESIAWLKYLSVYSFIDVATILNDGSHVIIATVVLAPMTLLLFIGGIMVFDRKSLAL